MCHYDESHCAEAIIKDGWVYIVDDFGGVVKMKYQEFESIKNKFKELTKNDNKD